MPAKPEDWGIEILTPSTYMCKQTLWHVKPSTLKTCLENEWINRLISNSRLDLEHESKVISKPARKKKEVVVSKLMYIAEIILPSRTVHEVGFAEDPERRARRIRKHNVEVNILYTKLTSDMLEVARIIDTYGVKVPELNTELVQLPANFKI